MRRNGTLSWGVKASLRNYVLGVGGTIDVIPPAEAIGSDLTFPLVAGNEDDNVLRFQGAVRFSAHQGVLDILIKDPWLHRERGSTTLSVSGLETPSGVRLPHPSPISRLVIAELVPSEPTRMGDILQWMPTPARLTAEGCVLFGSFYPARTDLDPVGYSIPTNATVT